MHYRIITNNLQVHRRWADLVTALSDAGMLKLIPDHPWCRTFSPHLTTHPHYTLLLPDSNSAVKRAGSKYLSKLRVGPGHPPNWPWMALEEWETAGYWCIRKSGHVLSLNHEQSLHKISQSPTAMIRDSNACTRSASKRLIVSYPDPRKGGWWILSTKFCRSRKNLMILHVLSHTTRLIHHTSADLISTLAETRVSPTHRLNLSWEYCVSGSTVHVLKFTSKSWP